MATETKVRCSEHIYSHPFGGHSCTRTGKVERNGKWYCNQHDPVAAAEKWNARHAAWQSDMIERRRIEAQQAATVAEQLRRAEAYPRLLAVLKAAIGRCWKHRPCTECDAAFALIAEIEGE